MSHPLEDLIREAEGFLLIGDSQADRFPAYSFHNYTVAQKRFHCLDLGGLSESRGASAGLKVYTSVDELPPERGDLAVIWVHPHRAREAVEVAHEAGCKKVWFSFGTGHPSAVARARELAMEVVEIGRCPIYYMDRKIPACRLHSLIVKVSGSYGRPPQTDPEAKRREMW
jgi:predicted CoA-binding protein